MQLLPGMFNKQSCSFDDIPYNDREDFIGKAIEEGRVRILGRVLQCIGYDEELYEILRAAQEKALRRKEENLVKGEEVTGEQSFRVTENRRKQKGARRRNSGRIKTEPTEAMSEDENEGGREARPKKRSRSSV